MKIVEVFGFGAATCFGIACGCMRPSVPVFVGWITCWWGIAFLIAAIGRIDP